MKMDCRFEVVIFIYIFLDVVAEKQILTYKHLLNTHAKRLEKIHILKKALFICKSPINIKVRFLIF